MFSFSAAEPGKSPVPDQHRQRDGRKAPAARKSNFHVDNPLFRRRFGKNAPRDFGFSGPRV
jgi:hypothetical protein